MISNRSEELFTNLKKFLKEECDIREQDISLQTNIKNDLDLSSFDLIETTTHTRDFSHELVEKP